MRKLFDNDYAPAPNLTGVAKRIDELPLLDDNTVNVLLSLDDFQGLFLIELIEIFIASIPDVLSDLALAFQANVTLQIARIAHKAKGMAANLGANRLVYLLSLMEFNIESYSASDRTQLLAFLTVEHSAFVDALIQTRRTLIAA